MCFPTRICCQICVIVSDFLISDQCLRKKATWTLRTSSNIELKRENTSAGMFWAVSWEQMCWKARILSAGRSSLSASRYIALALTGRGPVGISSSSSSMSRSSSHCWIQSRREVASAAGVEKDAEDPVRE